MFVGFELTQLINQHLFQTLSRSLPAELKFYLSAKVNNKGTVDNLFILQHFYTDFKLEVSLYSLL